MKTILTFLLLLSVGCTPLVIKEPIGSNYTPEQLKEFEGTWMLEQNGEASALIQLKLINEEGHFRTAYVEWDNEEQKFQLNENEIILKKGNEYGILHLTSEDEEENPHDLLLITLFRITEKGKIEYWNTISNETEAFLNSGILKTENIDGDIVIVDKPEKIIQILEPKVVHLSDPDCVTTATKLVRQDGVSD